MRIAVVGTRGVPGVHGGVERHCEELYPRIASLGQDVRVYAREGYVGSQEYRGVHVIALPAPRGRGMEAFAHTAVAMKRALADGCDVLHVHSVGPCGLIPFARLLGARTVVATIHAPDYRQRKWGRATRAYLKLGERFGVTRSNAAICVASWYGTELEARYGRKVATIPNGPGLVGFTPDSGSAYLSRLGVTGGEYVLFVGRLVPDKRVEDLIEATKDLALPLVVAGEDEAGGYADHLRALDVGHVRFAGYVYGQDLADLYGGAAVFVLPSSVEGLPISALEAMSLGVPVVMSDIAANRELAAGGTCALLYPCGDVEALTAAMRMAVQPAVRADLVAAAKEAVRARYDWDRIAEQTVAIYEAARARSRG